MRGKGLPGQASGANRRARCASSTCTPAAATTLQAMHTSGPPQHSAASAGAAHAAPVCDPWLQMQAWQQTWLATADPSGRVRAWQRSQRLAQLIRASADSPLLARRTPGARTLRDFAPVGKAELMAGFDDWAVDRRITRAAVDAFTQDPGTVADAWLGRYLVWTSSGTSGLPGIYVQDAASLAAYDAIGTLRLRAPDPWQPPLGMWGLGRRLAYVGALGGPYAGHTSMVRLRRILPAAWAPRIDLVSVLLPLDEVAARLQALQPDVLLTYPTCAVALAQMQAQGGVGLQLREVWLGGEQLSAAQRQQVQQAFGAAVRNVYGASECHSMASECALGRLHLHDDWVILEPVDEQARAVPPGQFGHHTLLTNLANRTQPLLRYQLGDRVRFVPGACPCGCPLPVIEVQGRADDALVMPAQGGGTVTLLPLALESVLEEGTGITQFQVLRLRDGTLELRLDGSASARRAAYARCSEVLLAWLARQRVRAPRLALGDEAPARAPGSGKLRRVIDLQHGS